MDQIFRTLFKNYCMFKVSEKYIKDICYSNQFLPISVVYCSQKKWFFKTNTDFHERVKWWTGKPNSTP